MMNEDIYPDLRRQAFGWTMILIGVGTWIGLLVTDLISPNLATEWIVGAVATISICTVLYILRSSHLRLACYGAVICMWVSNAIITFYLPLPFFLYLFGLVIVLSSGLIRLSATIFFAGLSTVVMIAFAGAQHLAVGPLINIWGCLIASIVVSKSLYQALETVKRHHDYAIEQMNLARDRRAQLIKLTRGLQETTEALHHANVQLRYAREAADEARRLKVQFAANVSHELRTPINLIIGYSEIMVTAPEIYGTPPPPAYRSDIQAIYRNAKHLQDLINDILDISQIEASRLAIIKKKTDIRHTLLEAATMARDLVTAKGLQFHVEIPVELPEVWIDCTRIRQVVLNLLANAVRFTDEGTIKLQANQDNNEIIVCVSDTGIGIDKDDLGRVFEEFYQTENSLSRRGGTGLGLTLSMHVVQHHGGRLWVESDGIAGNGSTFSFTLPTADNTKLTRGKPVSRARTSQNPKCVIIFDDDVAIGQLFKRYLNKQEVVVCRSQDDLIRMTQTIQPSAVVLDRNRHNKEIEELLGNYSRDTTIISCPMPSRQRTAQTYGAVNHLVKPITRQTLINAILTLEKPAQRILVVDDERDITRMLSRMITSYDQQYVVWQAHNGEDGLAIMYRENPDVVLLDIQMPTMDGFSILHRMKRDPLLQQIPVILASAHDAEDATMSAMKGEITVVRPDGFNPVEVINCVDAVVNVLMPSAASMPQEN